MRCKRDISVCVSVYVHVCANARNLDLVKRPSQEPGTNEISSTGELVDDTNETHKRQVPNRCLQSKT